MVKVRTQGLDWVVLDQGRVDDGNWWAVKIRGEWRVTKPLPGEDPPASGARYREHDCTEFADAAEVVAKVMPAGPVSVREVTGSTTLGPCAGLCGAVVVRFGPGASPLCGDCSDVLERWRTSRPPRGTVRFGRLVDGVYRQANTESS